MLEFENVIFLRVKVFLCFYCRFEAEKRPAMRGHFREAHDMRVHVEDEQEEGEEDCR